ncbi:MAG TPA: peptide chain release factor-like protein [Candidatus Absconditabacterales bacterium]|nr:peptide chain release factor-like protein [Candidatus Absconditabacterales bacterium]HMT27339.1 peptide chain release factor-like protein [Candidatus Absconditabacterales bacterium]
MSQRDQIMSQEIQIRHSKSGGHGGQNVNKRETKAELYFSIKNSQFLDENQKKIFYEKAKNHISDEGVLRLTAQEQRSLGANIQIVKQKFLRRLESINQESKQRIPTVIPFAIHQARQISRKYHSVLKKLRREKNFS